MDYLSRARKVVEIELAEVRTVAARLDAGFEKAVDLIKSAVESRGKVVVLGVGKSGHVGEKIAATLTSTGSPAVVLNSLNALHGDLGVVSDGDVVLAFSYSGETDELINILPALARFNIRKIAITGAVNSTLATACDVVLDVRVSQEACPLNLAPTSSTTAMLVIGDALAMVLLEARGFNKEDFARYHPAGRLGRALLLKVHQIMRGEDQLAKVSPDTPIVDVIKRMTTLRAGAAVVVERRRHPRRNLYSRRFRAAFSADAGHRQMCGRRIHDAQANHHLRRQTCRGGSSRFTDAPHRRDCCRRLWGTSYWSSRLAGPLTIENPLAIKPLRR